ncbi:DUF4214 domain-containing protein [Undibacterium fentianense]|uniref:DUF4214 domain-containing protein n=1 Tax=Undibacterium fentianense TaxID=2828728 RepID=A0A941IGC3_9BURK|nr:DUF4214 domain-containing protein [Undibacterium fentianense]MBR7801227.1 DUF4214 domain-containing protein [Undibacterium fentianense]
MAGVNYQYELTKLYLAAFIRPPEKSGLEYWLLQLESGKSFDSVLETVFSLDIVKEIYPSNLPYESFVTLIYVNVFGKSPDLEGLSYWKQQMIDGRSRGNLVMDMINAGLNTLDGTPGKAYIVNRMAVSQAAIEQQYAQRADFQPAYLKSLMATVNSDVSTVTTATKAMNSSVTGIGIGAPLNAITVVAAAGGISAAEVKAGVAVVIDLKGTNAVANNVVELLINKVAFTTPITKVLTDTEVKAQKLTITIPSTVNWGADGIKVLSAYVKDASGNKGLPGGDLAVELNMVAPNAPVNPIVIPVALNGINTAEKAAGVSVKVDLAGTTANTGDKVEILNGGQIFSPAAAATITEADVKAGFVTIVISGASNWGADGEKILSARITDAAGNPGGTGGNLAVVLDATPPTALTNPLSMAVASGGISPDERAQNIAVIANLTGTNVQVGDAIELLIDGKTFANSTIHILTAAEITAKFATLSIAGSDPGWGVVDGDKNISARIIDQAGNLGNSGGNLKVTLDSTPPNSQNSILTVAAAVNGINALEAAAGISVVMNLTNTNAVAGDIVNLFLDGKAFSPAVTFTLTAVQISAKSVTLIIPSTTDWGVDGNKVLSATLTDSAGNVGIPGGSLTVNLDRTAPGTPTNPISIPVGVNGINASEKIAGVNVLVDLAGTNALTGDKIELTIDGQPFTSAVSKVLTAADVANGFLNLSISSGAGWGTDGNKALAARVVDVAGNVSPGSTSISVILDTSAPAGPGFALVVPANSGGGITTAERLAGVDVQVNLTGTTVVAGDTVEILLAGNSFTIPVRHTLTDSEIIAKVATLTIGSNDGWGIDGTKVLTARFIDFAGNTGTTGAPLSVNLDGTAPNAPGATLSIPVAVNGINNAEKSAGVLVAVDLTGTGAIAGDTLHLQIDGVPFSTPVSQIITTSQIAAKLANIVIPGTAVWGADGLKSLTASITDALGNAGNPGGVLTILLDTTIPDGPSNPVVISAATNGINAVEKAAGVSVLVDLTGSTVVQGEKVELLLGGLPFTTPIIQTLSATDMSNGFFTAVIPSGAGWGADGSKLISVRMTDSAGNVGISSAGASLVLDTTPPVGPANALNVPANAGGGITGAEKSAGVVVNVSLVGSTAAVGDTLEILIDGASFANPVKKVLGVLDLAAQAFSLTIDQTAGWGIDGPKTLTALVTDAAGNAGTATANLLVTLLDTTAPNAPSHPLTVPVATNGISAAEKNAGVTVVVDLSGTNAVAGDTASLFLNGAAFAVPITHLITGAEVIAGNFSFTISSGAGWGADGSYLLNTSITDAVGNIGAVGGDLTVILDTTTPAAPTNGVVVAAAASGINAAEKTAGVQVSVDLSGTNAVAGDRIEILLGGSAFTTPVLHTLTGAEITAGFASATIDATSGWGIDGVKTISARVVDLAGNIGASGGSLTTFIDSIVPAASGLPTWEDLDSSGTISDGDRFLFSISEATNKAITLSEVLLNNSHVLGTGALVNWSTDGTQLLLTLGTGSTIATGDTVTLVGVSDLAGNTLNLSFTI